MLWNGSLDTTVNLDEVKLKQAASAQAAGLAIVFVPHTLPDGQTGIANAVSGQIKNINDLVRILFFWLLRSEARFAEQLVTLTNFQFSSVFNN